MGLWMILEKKHHKNTVHQNTITRGLISIIIHPQQIPFWMGAGVVLNRFMPLNMHTGALSLFIVYNAIGSLLAMFTYMFFGKKVLNYFKLNISHINKVMGSLYVLLAISQLLNT
jgi:small neutral amino acid transporter SnatA (MarC family)